MTFKSFDVVSEVVTEANKQFAPLFMPVPENIVILKDYCRAIDGLIREYEGQEFECTIDGETMLVGIRFTITDITVNSPAKDVFQNLAARSRLLEITNSGGDHICVGFVFPSLWKRTE